MADAILCPSGVLAIGEMVRGIGTVILTGQNAPHLGGTGPVPGLLMGVAPPHLSLQRKRRGREKACQYPRLVTSQVGGCVTVGLVSGSHDIPKAGHISGGWVCHCGTSEWVT